jgi:integrase
LRMSRLRKRLGLSRDARGEQLVCYSVRHTGATRAAAAGVRDRILADIMGHTNTRTTARYQHLEVSHLTAAIESIRPKKNMT